MWTKRGKRSPFSLASHSNSHSHSNSYNSNILQVVLKPINILLLTLLGFSLWVQIGYFSPRNDDVTNQSVIHKNSIKSMDPDVLVQRWSQEPLYTDAVKTDAWKSTLYQRLDRVRSVCGALCQINDKISFQKYSVPIQGFLLPQIKVPVDCPAILNNQDIDAGDTTAPAYPPELLPYYSMGGNAIMTDDERRREIYLKGKALENVWEKDQVNIMVQQAKNNTLVGSYKVEGSIYVRDRLKSLVDINDKSVLVIGSERPWVEAILLSLGAAKVTTLEYGTIDSRHPQIFTMTPPEFRSKYLDGTLEEFDGVVTHSSLEHSGLGRYGDALNPWGDLLAVARAWCTTKTGGFLYLGVPTGADRVYSNWHRVYGRMRWPLVTANWKPLDQLTAEQYDLPSTGFSAPGGLGNVFVKE